MVLTRSNVLLLLAAVLSSSTWDEVSAFAPALSRHTFSSTSSSTILFGKLNDFTKELYGADPNPDIEKESREATTMDKENVDRYGAGEWKDYVDFDEFDGGDGQMGVAGDGNKKLEKFGKDVQLQLAKSKVMSAKNAWGRTTGYADSLIEKGMEATRAQQIENWRNQQEVLQQRRNHRYMTDEFDSVKSDEDWRKLASFGVERNQDFDLNQAFGEVKADLDNIEATFEFPKARVNGPFVIHEFGLKNPFMGFADFRAALTADTSKAFTVTPTEGAISHNADTNFIVKFKAQSPGITEGYLVIQTEDMKKTYKLIGSTS